jgi:N-acetyl-gamma-glutamyl-phosphate reductase
MARFTEIDVPRLFIKVAIVGVTGYTGQELVRLLLLHENVQIKSTVSHSHNEKFLTNVYPGFSKTTDLICEEANLEKLAAEVDVIFLALPHGQAASKVNEKVLAQCKVIDLGGDFRLKNVSDYEHWYKLKHASSQLLNNAVYGLPELNRKTIVTANLIANPGCYATCSILTLAPLIDAKMIDNRSIIIDAKSGVSGAGRATDLSVHFNECNESLKAYQVATHRHTPEIEQALSILTDDFFPLTFTPHLVPMNRGILVTAYASLLKEFTAEEIADVYRTFYANEPFIRFFDALDGDYKHPETRFVKGSNFCDISVSVDARTKRVICIGAIDNLVKGAAGQAIQNMNLLFGLPETTGLQQAAIFPA